MTSFFSVSGKRKQVMNKERGQRACDCSWNSFRDRFNGVVSIMSLLARAKAGIVPMPRRSKKEEFLFCDPYGSVFSGSSWNIMNSYLGKGGDLEERARNH